ncbi:MAG: hypothetical protein WKF84_04880 [Pyrinomonadaceae bacterium]
MPLKLGGVARSAGLLQTIRRLTTLAVLTQNSFAVNALAVSVYYERAVSLSPNDYRLWFAERESRRATKRAAKKRFAGQSSYAVFYAYPRWLLGNLLLRDGRQDEAFAEPQTVSEADPGMRPQVFGLAWRAFNADVPAVTEAVAPSASARAQLAQFLAENKRLDGAPSGSLSANDKREQQETGQTLIRALAKSVLRM